MEKLIDSLETLEVKIKEVKQAQKVFSTYSQDRIDKIFKAAAIAANQNRILLAKMAVEETGIGVAEDKVIKNHYASEYIYNAYKDLKTCGVIEKDDSFGITKIAEPIGVLAGIIPTTNPTSTAIFKCLIALKSRNGIVFSPHPRAKNCTIAAAKLCLEAAVKAGAPEGIIGWIDQPSVELSQNVMRESDIILATGGPAMVKAAYSSGRPALGVGAGNTPAIIDESAHIKMAVNSILLSKTFDNGVICASEQSIIVLEEVYDEVKKELAERGAYILKGEENHKAEEQHIAAEVNARFDLLVDGLAANGFNDHEDQPAAVQTGNGNQVHQAQIDGKDDQQIEINFEAALLGFLRYHGHHAHGTGGIVQPLAGGEELAESVHAEGSTALALIFSYPCAMVTPTR